MTAVGRERPIRLATKMNTHIALRQAGNGQNRTLGRLTKSTIKVHLLHATGSDVEFLAMLLEYQPFAERFV